MNNITVALADGSLHEVNALDDTIKVQAGNGYRHFTYSGQSTIYNNTAIPVFHESLRTKIAE